MTKKEINKRFGLLGKNISYSFSRNYFTEKFKSENIQDAEYVNFDIPSIDIFPSIIKKEKNIIGLNVTIPYKQAVIPFLNDLNNIAKKIGAVNTIKITKENNLIGYNTDVIGFRESLKKLVNTSQKKALVLGTGGASKAIKFALNQLNISYLQVSRTPNKEQITYQELTKEIIEECKIIINCTPLGTSPNVELFPTIPYQFITNQHLLYDLIYNPSTTTFLKKGIDQGANVKNGLEMLQLQAEESWKIWNNQ